MVEPVLADQGSGPSQGENHEDQTGGLEPKGVERSPHRKYKGLPARKHRIEQAIFLYNALQRILDIGNLRHCGYCRPKMGVSLLKNKTEVPLAGIQLKRKEFAVNPRLKQLMKDLGEAINGSLSESEQIAQVIAKIKDEGFDIFLVLEATIGFNRHDEAETGAEETPSW